MAKNIGIILIKISVKPFKIKVKGMKNFRIIRN